MRLFMEQSSDSWKELDFAKYLYCTSSSVKVSNNFINFNARAGVSHKEGTSQIGSRSFAISGNFEADSPKDVEAFRSEIFTSLFNKPLRLYLDDEDDSYYNCVLDGNVNTTYNQGYSISRVFTLSFNLIATEPYRYGGEEDYVYIDSSIYNSCVSIYYKGKVPCFPDVYIEFGKETLITKSVDFMQCGNTYINFKPVFKTNSNDFYHIKKGIIRRVGKIFTPNCLDDNSILNPFMFTPGKNEIKTNFSNIPNIDYIEIYWTNLSY